MVSVQKKRMRILREESENGDEKHRDHLDFFSPPFVFQIYSDDVFRYREEGTGASGSAV